MNLTRLICVLWAQIPVCAGGVYRYKIYFREDFYVIVWRFEADSIIGFLNRERERERERERDFVHD